MILISHRGNISGPKPEYENDSNYIESALQSGFDVEIDIFFYKNSLWLGHDLPKHKIKNVEWLKNKHLWCHAKNIQALDFMLKEQNIHCFWHQEDDCALTSKGYIWTYPGKDLFSNSIVVLPEQINKTDFSNISGICSDYINKYK
tara:strand:+ start:767 stop:1201 length:435 start_codon:yes stop_codon:yes gene_type:complete